MNFPAIAENTVTYGLRLFYSALGGLIDTPLFIFNMLRTFPRALALTAVCSGFVAIKYLLPDYFVGILLVSVASLYLIDVAALFVDTTLLNWYLRFELWLRRRFR